MACPFRSTQALQHQHRSDSKVESSQSEVLHKNQHEVVPESKSPSANPLRLMQVDSCQPSGFVIRSGHNGGASIFTSVICFENFPSSEGVVCNYSDEHFVCDADLDTPRVYGGAWRAAGAGTGAVRARCGHVASLCAPAATDGGGCGGAAGPGVAEVPARPGGSAAGGAGVTAGPHPARAAC